MVECLADLDAHTPTGMELHCIVDNLSTHFTPKVAEFLEDRHHIFLHRTPTHASRLNQVELFFSILQRKVLTPNDLDSLVDLIDRIHAFGERYSALGKLFNWTFTRHELERRLRDPLLRLKPATSLHTAA